MNGIFPVKFKEYITTDSIIRWIGGVSAFIGIIILLFSCLFFTGDIFLLSFKKTTATVIAILYLLGILVIGNPTRHTGWYLIGCAISFSLSAGVFLIFSSDNILVGWIITSGILLSFLSCIYISLCNGIKNSRSQQNSLFQVKKKDDAIKEKDGEIEKYKKQIDNFALEKKEIQRKNEHQEKKMKSLEDSKNEIYYQLQESYQQLYESQLSGALHVMFALENKGNFPFGINNFQGSLDKRLADIIATTNGTFWMVELKRQEKDIITEWKKEARQKQYAALKTSEDEHLKKTALRCHWLGCGITGEAINANFDLYWPVVKQNKMTPDAMPLKDFVGRAYSKDRPLGISHSHFILYINFLIKNCGDDNTTAGIPFLLFCKDGSGKPFSVTTTLHRCNIAILEYQKRLEILQQQQKKDHDREYSLHR